AGSFPGQTETMPIAVYFALETDPDAAIALSLVLLAVSIVVLISLRDHWLRRGARAGPRAARPQRRREIHPAQRHRRPDPHLRRPDHPGRAGPGRRRHRD